MWLEKCPFLAKVAIKRCPPCHFSDNEGLVVFGGVVVMGL
jgi:hypothetical protein